MWILYENELINLDNIRTLFYHATGDGLAELRNVDVHDNSHNTLIQRRPPAVIRLLLRDIARALADGTRVLYLDEMAGIRDMQHAPAPAPAPAATAAVKPVAGTDGYNEFLQDATLQVLKMWETAGGQPIETNDAEKLRYHLAMWFRAYCRP